MAIALDKGSTVKLPYLLIFRKPWQCSSWEAQEEKSGKNSRIIGVFKFEISFKKELTEQTNQLNMKYQQEEEIRGVLLRGSVNQWWDALELENLIIFCSIYQVGILTSQQSATQNVLNTEYKAYKTDPVFERKVSKYV